MKTFEAAGANRLADRDYFDFVMACVETATSRVLAALFLYDLRPPRDVRGQVLQLTTALAQRRAVGVDVRVVLSGYATTPDISVANLASALFMESRGVPHRHFFSSGTD